MDFYRIFQDEHFSACVEDADSLLWLGMLYFFFFFLPIAVSHQNLNLPLLSGNKHEWIETFTECAEWSQFVVYLFSNMIYFKGFLVIEDFSQRPTIHYSSDGFAVSTDYLWVSGIVTSQPIRVCCLGNAEWSLKREFSATLADSRSDYTCMVLCTQLAVCLLRCCAETVFIYSSFIFFIKNVGRRNFKNFKQHTYKTEHKTMQMRWKVK